MRAPGFEILTRIAPATAGSARAAKHHSQNPYRITRQPIGRLRQPRQLHLSQQRADA